MDQRLNQVARSITRGPLRRATLGQAPFGRLGRHWISALLLSLLLLAACGTTDSTPGAGIGFGSDATTSASATPPEIVIAEASPTALASPIAATPVATPHGTPPPISIEAYVQAISRIGIRQVQLARADLTLIASGADNAAIAAQLQSELTERQQLLDDMKNLNPPTELKTLQTNEITTEQQSLDAEQQLIQGVQTGNQSLIDGATETLLNGQLTQSYCSSSSVQEMLKNLTGLPIGTPSTSTLMPSAIRDYNDAILTPVNDMASQYRSLCPFLSNAISQKAAYVTQLKQILPAVSQDIDALARITPPDRFTDYHQDLVAGYQKLLESQKIEVQGYEQNDEAIMQQARVAQAEGELKLLDAQDALSSALINQITGP